MHCTCIRTNHLVSVGRQRVIAAADLDPDNASILVCGGGGVAIKVTRKLKDMGAWVWMLQRTEDRRKDIEGMMAIVAKGDALNKAEVDKVFAGGGHRRVVSCMQGQLVCLHGVYTVQVYTHGDNSQKT